METLAWHIQDGEKYDTNQKIILHTNLHNRP